METFQLDPNCNLTEETSPKQLLPSDSPDISDKFGDPQLSPRVGDKYQVEIPPMITGSEHIRLLMDPVDSEDSPYLAHSFLLGLPVPVMWTDEQDIDLEDECKGDPSKLDDGTKVDEFLKSRKCRNGQNSERKKNSVVSAEVSDAKKVNRKELKAENLECEMTSKENLFRPCEGKSSHLIPGSSGNSWSNKDVDGFLLGLYIFGKDFGRIKRFIGNKEMGDILSFYYGAFYKSDRYRRWSDSQKRSRKIVYGRKIFTGWRQQELLSRLLTRVPDELQNNLQEVSKSFLEGRISLENYVYHLKTSAGICALVEAVAIGKGKADLTCMAMDPSRTTQVSPEIPSGKDCSSLTSGEVIRLLTGGFRLSKARSNDIFWEAVWPRLLARGWHSEQPKNQCFVSSKHYLVFLMPGVKFSRRKLVKGNHYFDSVSDVLSKVASEPTLIELDSEGNGIGSCNEENGCIPGDSSDQDDHPNPKPSYLLPRPQAFIFSSNHMKFTVVDSSLAHRGKASKIRELRYPPIDLMFTSKPMQKDTLDSQQVNANHVMSKGDKCVTNARHNEGIIASSNTPHIKFTIVDTSLLHGGKSSWVRELRHLPIKFEISSEISKCSGGNEDNSSDDSLDEHEQNIADRLSSHGSVATDTKPSCEPVPANNFLKGEGKYDNDSSNQNPENSCIADHSLLIHQDKRTYTSEDARSKRIIKHHFSRRAKSSHSVSLVPPEKRKKLTTCVNAEAIHMTENFAAVSVSLSSPMKRQRSSACAKMELTENISGNPINLVSPMKRHRLNACAKTEESCLTEKFSSDISDQTWVCCALKSKDEGSNDTLPGSHFQDKVSSIISSVEGNPESMETPPGSSEKLLSLSSFDSGTPLLPPGAQNGEPGMGAADGSQFIIVNNYADLLKSDTNVCAEKQQPIVNSQRKSKRSRPLTTRVLEALESGFLNMKRLQNVREAQAQAIQFSSPSRKARSIVKATSKHGNTGAKTVDAKGGKGTDGALICSKDVMNKPPQVAS